MAEKMASSIYFRVYNHTYGCSDGNVEDTDMKVGSHNLKRMQEGLHSIPSFILLSY